MILVSIITEQLGLTLYLCPCISKCNYWLRIERGIKDWLYCEKEVSLPLAITSYSHVEILFAISMI